MLSKFKLSKKRTEVLSASDRGKQAEEIVKNYFVRRNYRILYHQKRIFGVEFDWILQGREGIIYVEVKSVRSPEFYLNRWPLNQKRRFLRVAEILSAKQKSQFYLALVDYQDQIQFFKVGSET